MAYYQYLTIIILIILPLNLHGTGAARILFHMPGPTHSHNIVYQSIIKAMVNRGHHVVSVTTNPLDESDLINGTLLQIDVGFSSNIWKSAFGSGCTHSSVLSVVNLYGQVMCKMAEMQLEHPQVIQLMQNKSERFDLVIIEAARFFPILGWGHRFQCSIVGILSLDPYIDVQETIGNPSHPYSIANMFMDFLPGEDVSFLDRMRSAYNSIVTRYDPLWAEYERVLKKVFGSDAPSVYELSRNMSLLITDQIEIFNPRPKVPGNIYINMLHIRPPKSLPKNLESFMERNSNGVIYFSLGSNIKSSNLPKKTVDKLIDVFARLPYDVLWKWEKERLPNQPSNVMLCQWCPQQDILAMNSVKLFITQGGLQSIEEAIHYGVPVLGIPFMVDQKQNLLHLKKWGAGDIMSLDEINGDEFYHSIKKICSNESYRKNIRELAALIEDQPMKPLDKVVWWLEYVIRHQGAEHLRAPVLPWHLHLMLDFIVVVLILSSIFIYTTYHSVRFLYFNFIHQKRDIKTKVN